MSAWAAGAYFAVALVFYFFLLSEDADKEHPGIVLLIAAVFWPALLGSLAMAKLVRWLAR